MAEIAGWATIFSSSAHWHILETGLGSCLAALVLIFVPWWLFSSVEHLKRSARNVLSFWRRIDNAIVEYGSYIVGTRYSGWRRRLVFVVLAAAIVWGIVADGPAIAGVSLTAGLIMIFIVLRHWSRDEDERLRMVPKDYKLVPTEDDLRYEAAFALVLLFGIAPMGLSRLDETCHCFDGRGSALLDTIFGAARYAAYSWYEFPHSMPIIHAFSAFYEGNPFGPDRLAPLVRIATFLLRLSYEIFAVSAIVSLVRVGQRIADLEDMRPIDDWLATADEANHARAVDALGDLATNARLDALDRLVDIINGRPPKKNSLVQYSPAIKLRARSALLSATRELGLFVGYIQNLVEGYQRHTAFSGEGIGTDGR